MAAPEPSLDETGPASDRRALSRQLGVGVRARSRRILRGAGRQLRLRHWFPEVPLFLLVLGFGLLQLQPVVHQTMMQTRSLHLGLMTMMDVPPAMVMHVAQGAPIGVVGLFLAMMSLALLTRARLAWTVTLMIAAISLVLLLTLHEPTSISGGKLIAANAALILLLAVSVRRFRRSSLATATLFAFTSLLLLLAYAVVGAFVLGDGFAPPIGDFATALYFSVVTMSTVGYGDIIPKTTEARLFVASVIILGITVFATSLSTLSGPLIQRRMQALLTNKEKKVKRSNHFVIVGDSALARNTYKELAARDHQLTVLVEREPETVPEGLDLVIADPSSLDGLRRADAADAHALLALGDDDSENAFVVLAAKELSSTLRVVAVVNDARNMSRVKRCHPDLIIAPQVLGGELLAMALSGERMDGNAMLKQLLQVSEINRSRQERAAAGGPD